MCIPLPKERKLEVICLDCRDAVDSPAKVSGVSVIDGGGESVGVGITRSSEDLIWLLYEHSPYKACHMARQHEKFSEDP